MAGRDLIHREGSVQLMAPFNQLLILPAQLHIRQLQTGSHLSCSCSHQLSLDAQDWGSVSALSGS